MKKLTVRLDESLHKNLKIQCVERGISINEFITKLIIQNVFNSNEEVSIAKEVTNDSDKNLEYIKATMAYENFEIPNYIYDILKDTLSGKYSDEQARQMILKKHGLV